MVAQHSVLPALENSPISPAGRSAQKKNSAEKTQSFDREMEKVQSTSTEQSHASKDIRASSDTSDNQLKPEASDSSQNPAVGQPFNQSDIKQGKGNAQPSNDTNKDQATQTLATATSQMDLAAWQAMDSIQKPNQENAASLLSKADDQTQAPASDLLAAMEKATDGASPLAKSTANDTEAADPAQKFSTHLAPEGKGKASIQPASGDMAMLEAGEKSDSNGKTGLDQLNIPASTSAKSQQADQPLATGQGQSDADPVIEGNQNAHLGKGAPAVDQQNAQNGPKISEADLVAPNAKNAPALQEAKANMAQADKADMALAPKSENIQAKADINGAQAKPQSTPQTELPTEPRTNLNAQMQAKAADIPEADLAQPAAHKSTAQGDKLTTPQNQSQQASQSSASILNLKTNENGQQDPNILQNQAKAAQASEGEIKAETGKSDNPLADQNQKPALGQQDRQDQLAKLRSPKGAIFSEILTGLQMPNGKQTLAMDELTDTSSELDLALAGQERSVRLSGFDAFARTGQLPSSNSLANAQAIAAQISRHVRNGENRFEIRLDPAELGKIDVRLTIGSDGQARAHLFVERPETMDFLMRDQRMLERTLQQSGLQLEDKGLEFSLMDQQGQGQKWSDQQNQSSDQSDQHQANIISEGQPADLPMEMAGNPNQTYSATDGVNLVI